MKINRVYYAYCIRDKTFPEWKEKRDGSQLNKETKSLLLDYINTLIKKMPGKQTRIHEMGDIVIPIDDPNPQFKKKSIKTILPEMLEINMDTEKNKFDQFAEIIAKKYLVTNNARDRAMFILNFNNDSQTFIGIIGTDLVDEMIHRLDANTHNLTLEEIKNYIPPELKKGAIFPGIIQGKIEKNKIKIYQKNYADYFPNALECKSELTMGEQLASFSTTIDQISKEMKIEIPYKKHFEIIREIKKNKEDEIKIETIENNIKRIFKQNEIDMSKALNKAPMPERIKDIIRNRGSISKNAFSNTKIEIKIEDAKVSFPYRYWSEEKVLLFKRNGYQYFIIRGTNLRAKAEGKQMPISFELLTWDDFKKKIES